MLSNNEEIWIPVKDFESYYEVSSTGRIRNFKGLIMKTYIINSGYEAIKFTIDSKVTSKLVHRLVAEAFISNPENKREVNHIDEDKQNNFYLNLVWATSSENKQHSIALGTYDKIYTTKNSLGKKHLPNPKSCYHNVTYDKNRDKWAATIRVNGRNMFSKRFNTEIEAALHVNWIIDTLNLIDRPKNIII